MGDAECNGFEDVGMSKQRLLDFGRRNLLPSPFDDILDAADNEKISVAVQVSEVAGSEPTVAKGGLRCDDIVVVASRDGGAAQRNLAAFAGRKPPALAVHDCDFGPGRPADR